MLKFIRLVLACALVVGLGLPVVAHAQQSPPLPPGCQTGALPTEEPQYPVQLILVCIPPLGWNGQLVVYAHGYVAPQGDLALPLAELTLLDANGQPVFAPAVLLSQGFAFATTSYRKNGYAIEQGGNDLNALAAHFNTLVPPGTLLKVYVVGASEGGLVTTMLVERFPDTYHGGLALCGPVGGAPFQVKYLGDFRVVFDYFFPDVFPFGAANVPPNAFLNWQTPDPTDNDFVRAITTAILSNPSATDQLFNVTRAARDPLDPETSAVTTAVGVLFYSIFGTNDLIATAGGMTYGNRLTRYRGSADNRALNAGVERVRADRTARAYIRHFYQTTGELERPLVTLHNTLDPVVPFTHELIYSALVAHEGEGDSLTILPVPGYGHCNFTVEQVLGAFGLLLLQSAGELDPELEDYLPALPEPYAGQDQ